MSAIADDLFPSKPLYWGWITPLILGLIMAMGFLVLRSSDPPPAGSCPNGNEINAASASRTDVNTAIASASAGDCVVVPADPSESWSGGVTISGIWLMGPGKDAGSPTVITGGTVSINSHATATTRVSGFRFTGTGQQMGVSHDRGEAMYFIDDNYFDLGVGTIITANGGVFFSNEVTDPTPTNADVFQSLGPDAHDEWTHADTMGTRDTDGDINFYMEDNEINGILETAPDCDNGSRLVSRHNAYNDSSIVGHSTSPNDSGDYGGCRHMEVYDNVFDRISNSFGINKWIWVRGASGVIRDNTWDDADSPDGSSYPGKPEISLTVGCPTGYPIQYQVGQDTNVATSGPAKPLVIYNNTGPLSIAIDGGPIVTCGSPGTYIQSGRDYVTTQTWTYTKYPYPHPARPDQ